MVKISELDAKALGVPFYVVPFGKPAFGKTTLLMSEPNALQMVDPGRIEPESLVDAIKVILLEAWPQRDGGPRGQKLEVWWPILMAIDAAKRPDSFRKDLDQREKMRRSLIGGGGSDEVATWIVEISDQIHDLLKLGEQDYFTYKKDQLIVRVWHAAYERYLAS